MDQMTANALKFHNLDYVHEMTDDDWNSWHAYMEAQERKEKYAATLSKDQKLEMLYQYQREGTKDINETNRLIANKLAKHGIPMEEYVTYCINRERP